MTSLRTNRPFENGGRSSPSKGRLLPSNTPNVQAALAALKSRSNLSPPPEGRYDETSKSDVNAYRQPYYSSMSESFESTDGNDRYYADIGNVIDALTASKPQSTPNLGETGKSRENPWDATSPTSPTYASPSQPDYDRYLAAMRSQDGYTGRSPYSVGSSSVAGDLDDRYFMNARSTNDTNSMEQYSTDNVDEDLERPTSIDDQVGNAEAIIRSITDQRKKSKHIIMPIEEEIPKEDPEMSLPMKTDLGSIIDQLNGVDTPLGVEMAEEGKLDIVMADQKKLDIRPSASADSDYSSDISGVSGIDDANIGNIIDQMNGLGPQHVSRVDIGNIIDQMNGKPKTPENPTGEEKAPDIKMCASDFSSDISSDGSFDPDKVSSATQVGIAAFIDSLHNDAKLEAKKAQIKESVNLQTLSTIDGTADTTDESKPDNYAEVRAQGTIDSCIEIDAKTRVEKYAQNEEGSHDDESTGEGNVADEQGAREGDKDLQEGEPSPPVEKLYNDDRVHMYIQRVTALAQEKVPRASRLDNIMFYARREGIPLLPLIDAFDQCRVDQAPTEATRLTHYIREAINLIETTEVTFNARSKLLSEADNENVDIAMLKQMLSQPEKHVRFVGYDPDLESEEDVEVQISKSKSKSSDYSGSGEHSSSGGASASLGSEGDKSSYSKSGSRSSESSEREDEADEDRALHSASTETARGGMRSGTVSKTKTLSDSKSLSESKSRSKSKSKSFSKSKSVSKSKTESKSVDSDQYLEGTFDTAPSLDIVFEDQILSESQDDEPDPFEGIQKTTIISDYNKRRHFSSYLKRKRVQLAAAKQRCLGIVDPTEEKMFDIDAVDATKLVFSRAMFRKQPSVLPYNPRNWKLSKTERTKAHDGYRRISAAPVLERAGAIQLRNGEDGFDWAKLEFELVGLGSAMLEKERWFGTITQNRLNNRKALPFVKEISLISMDRLVYPKVWEEEWYVSYLSRKQNPGRSRNNDISDVKSRYSVFGNPRPSSSHSYMDNMSMNEFGARSDPNMDKSIGKVYCMRYRAGERVSRVHWDYTSFLFKSRWRKKYYPKGIF